jgi:multidrug efflux system outer membrane protein
VKLVRCAALVLASLGIGGCTPKGPAYQKPDLPLPAGWTAPEPFRQGEPRDAWPKGTWWTIFGDAELSALEARAIDANQSLKVAEAQFAQARALTAAARSALYPRVAIDGQVLTQRLSGTRAGATEANTQSAFSVPASVSYEADLFGRERRSVDAATAELQASAADLENVRLILTAELATDYFSARQLDSETQLLDRTVDVLQRALDLVRNRFNGGIASGLDVAQEEALLAATRTQATLLHEQRDRFEHAIAVLVGAPAPAFRLPVRPLTVRAPALGLGLPSDLLERRPDVAAAERAVAAANARVGVARAAFFPSLNLLGSAGWESGSLLKLLDVPSVVWAVGATLTQDVFTGGARRAQVDYAVAGFQAAAAAYRDTVLRALAEVEDAVSGLQVLADAQTSQADAVAASSRAMDIANNRYTGGLASALDLVSAQQTLLANQRLAAQLEGERLATSVALVKALGGGWDAGSLTSLGPPASSVKP